MPELSATGPGTTVSLLVDPAMLVRTFAIRLSGLVSLRLAVAVAVYAVLIVYAARHVADAERPIAWLALLTIPLAVVRPAVAMILGALILRVAFVGFTPTDPIDNAHYAFDRAFSGQNPYAGHVYPNGTAYVYGPLGLVSYQLGIPGEILASLGTSIILAHQRAWVTLGLFSSFPLLLFTASTGANDHSPTFLLVAALVLMRSHGKTGAALLACAAAVKPYALAWALPAVGFGGLSVLAVWAITTALLWAPVLGWGPGSFIKSVQSVQGDWAATGQLHASWGLNIPVLSWLALPIAFGSLFVHSWRGMALIGASVFAVFLGFGAWANVANLVPLVAVVGLALEVRNGEERWRLWRSHDSSGDVRIRPATGPRPGS